MCFYEILTRTLGMNDAGMYRGYHLYKVVCSKTRYSFPPIGQAAAAVAAQRRQCGSGGLVVEYSCYMENGFVLSYWRFPKILQWCLAPPRSAAVLPFRL